MRKLILITLGEPWSINAQAISSLIDQPEFCDASQRWPILIAGSLEHWVNQVKRYQFECLYSLNEIACKSSGVYFYNTGGQGGSAPDLSEEQRGHIAVNSLRIIDSIQGGEEIKLAVLTAPIDKYTATQAGFEFPGQTEFFENAWQGEGLMFLAGDKLKVGLATNHLPLHEVSSAISAELIVQKAKILDAELKRLFTIPNPRIAVCGLNPHCSDQGLFGWQEKEVIEPACDKLKNLNYDVCGPFPADTIFSRAMRGEFDAVLAMYHDQGLGPFKLIHFHDGVHITAGLRHLRVSPDHGPAKDLFGKNNASYSSFYECFKISVSYLDG